MRRNKKENKKKKIKKEKNYQPYQLILHELLDWGIKSLDPMMKPNWLWSDVQLDLGRWQYKLSASKLSVIILSQYMLQVIAKK